MDATRRKATYLDLDTIKQIAVENDAIGYKRSEEFITLWKRHDIIPNYYAYMTFQQLNPNTYRAIGAWETTNHNPGNVIELDRLGE